MPFDNASAGMLSSLFVSPRALNEPVACKFSSFRLRSAGVIGSASAVTSRTGVRRTKGAMRSAAASMSVRVIVVIWKVRKGRRPRGSNYRGEHVRVGGAHIECHLHNKTYRPGLGQGA